MIKLSFPGKEDQVCLDHNFEVLLLHTKINSFISSVYAREYLSSLLLKFLFIESAKKLQTV